MRMHNSPEQGAFHDRLYCYQKYCNLNRTMKSPRQAFLYLVCALAIASACAQLQPPQPTDSLKRLNDLMNSSGYFFPGPRPNEGEIFGAAFMRDPSIIKGNELPAIQGAQAYGKRMMEGVAASRECAKNPDHKIAAACSDFVAKFCDRARSAFELSRDETDWWRRNSAEFQHKTPATKSISVPQMPIQQIRLAECGVEDVRVFTEADMGPPPLAMLATPPTPQAIATIAPQNTNAIEGQSPALMAIAPKAVAGMLANPSPGKDVERGKLETSLPQPKGLAVPNALATASPIKNAERPKFETSPPASQEESTKLSKAAPHAAVVTAASPVPSPLAGRVASRDSRTESSQIAAISPESKAVKTKPEKQELEVKPTPGAIRGAMTGTFAGQLFGYSKGHIFSSDLILTLVSTGNEVKGVWTSEQGNAGKVTGTWTGSNTNLRMEQIEPCAGTYAGSATIVEGGSRLHGSYTGTDCKGKIDASFIVIKH
jgi:hypothetical protein